MRLNCLFSEGEHSNPSHKLPLVKIQFERFSIIRDAAASPDDCSMGEIARIGNKCQKLAYSYIGPPYDREKNEI